MRILFVLIALFISTANATGIGEDIIECLYQSGVRADSPNFLKAIEACDKLVAEQQKSRKQYQQDLYDKALLKVEACLHHGAWELDDGISPAGDIAKALALQCSDHWNEILEIDGLGIYTDTGLSIEQLERVAMVYVLRHRKTSRK